MRKATKQILLALVLFLLLNGCGSRRSPTATPTALMPTKASPTSTPTLMPEGKTIIVTSTKDSGLGTLRQALEEAQSGDTITFDRAVFPPTAPVTISITSELPHIHQGNLTIDGSNVGVILDGSSFPDEIWIFGIGIQSNRNTVLGLQIVNFPGPGFGLIAGSQNNTIEGNLISKNRNVGIFVSDSSFNTIRGNYIGTDLSGTEAWGNHYNGIFIDGGSHSQIIDNLICDNGASAISLQGSNTHSNAVSENLIGVDANQSLLMGNGGIGIEIRHGAWSVPISL